MIRADHKKTAGHRLPRTCLFHIGRTRDGGPGLAGTSDGGRHRLDELPEPADWPVLADDVDARVRPGEDEGGQGLSGPGDGHVDRPGRGGRGERPPAARWSRRPRCRCCWRCTSRRWRRWRGRREQRREPPPRLPWASERARDHPARRRLRHQRERRGLPSGAGWPACDGDACECGPSASPGAGLGAVLADRAARQRATRSSALTSRTWMGGPTGMRLGLWRRRQAQSGARTSTRRPHRHHAQQAGRI